MPKKTQLHKKTLYKETFPIDAYILAKSGNSNNAIAEALGVQQGTFEEWLKRHEPLRYAVQLAREGLSGSSSESFLDYVFKRLPAELRDVWAELQECEKADNGFDRVEEILADKPTRFKQHLFLHAFVHCNFQASRARTMLNLSEVTLDSWKKDPGFTKIMGEIHNAKKDFFEGSLIKLVKNGNVLATVFANRTLNRDRGYADKVSVEHSGNINLNVRVFPVDRLGLPLETRKQILDNLRRVKEVEEAGELEAGASAPKAIEIEVVDDDPDDDTPSAEETPQTPKKRSKFRDE